jgi:hypothetical protein
MRRTIGFNTAPGTATAGPSQQRNTDYFASPVTQAYTAAAPHSHHSRETCFSKTSTAAFPSKHSLLLTASAPDPSEFFEAPQVEIDKFDRKFSKTALRQYKYPKVELDRHNRQVEQYNKRLKTTSQLAAFGGGPR